MVISYARRTRGSPWSAPWPRCDCDPEQEREAWESPIASCSDRCSATFSRAVLQRRRGTSRSPIQLRCRGQGRRRARRAPPRLMETRPAVAVDGIVMAPLGAGADVRTGSRQRLPRPLHPREAAPRPRARTGRRHRRRQLAITDPIPAAVRAVWASSASLRVVKAPTSTIGLRREAAVAVVDSAEVPVGQRVVVDVEG